VINPKKKALVGLSGAMLALVAALPASGAPAPRLTHLTKATAGALAVKDAQAAVVISAGDKVQASGCHAVGHGAFRCQMLLIPVKSSSRCRFSETVSLVHGRPVFAYSKVTGC
jgi:hypothetical protein